MQLSSLQLEGYFLKEFSFALNEDIKEKPAEVKKSDNLGIEVSVLVDCLDKKARRWRCELTLDLKPKDESDSAYNLHLVLVGFFNISENFPEEKVEVLARTNCPALLYTTAREMVVTVVRRSPYAPVLIPSVTFLENETKTEESKPAKKKAVKKKKLSE
jgi:preprotein translocase subunit SecB